MFCKNCGTQFDDAMAFCPSCGTKNDSVAPAPAPAPAPAQTPKDKKGMIIKIAIAAAVAVVVILIISAIAKPGYQKPVDKFAKGIVKQNAEMIVEAMPEALDVDEDEIEKYYIDELYKHDWKEEVGKVDKVSYKIVDATKYSDVELEKLQDRYEENDDIDEITDAYKVYVKFNYKGSKGKSYDRATFVAAKVDGKWCVLDY